jgi:hypothetical protein
VLIVAGVLLFFGTGDRRYLRFAYRVAVVTLAAALVAFMLMALAKVF